MPTRTIFRSCALVAALFLSVQPGPAHAHATLDIKTAQPGPFRAAVRVPHGCEGSPTIAVRVTIPEGVIGVKPAPKPGWSVATTKGRHARTYDYFHGRTESEGVKEIVWRGGPLADEHFDEFLFVGFVTDALQPGSAVVVPVVQDCEKGSLAWVETAAPGVDPHSLKAPAPVLRIVTRPGAEPAAPAAALNVRKAWSRATPGGAKVAAGYLEIANPTAEPDRLLTASAPIAARAEIHEMRHEGGVMTMRPLADGLDIAAGQTVTLGPGGLHLMFVDLAAPLTAGQTFDLELTFAKAGVIKVPVVVQEIGASGPSDPHASHH